MTNKKMHQRPAQTLLLTATRTALMSCLCLLLGPTQSFAQQPYPITVIPAQNETHADEITIDDQDEQSAEENQTGEYLAEENRDETEQAENETEQTEIIANDVPLAEQAPTITATNFPTEEFLGFTVQEDQRSLGNAVFRGSTRSALTDLFKSLPAFSGDLALHKTTNQLLLTAGHQQDIINDVQPAMGEDILTLRLEKMLERGLYAEAASIYTSLESEPYDERLAAAGLTALIMTGRKSLACLDIKTFFEGQPKTKTWQELSAYCNYVMTVASGSETAEQPQSAQQNQTSRVLSQITATPQYTQSYTPRLFTGMSQFERAIMIGESRVTIDVPTLRTLIANKQIPPTDIQPLLQMTTLDLGTRLLLIATGIQSASVSNATLLGLFKTAQIDSEPGAAAASLIQIYRRIKAKEPDDDPVAQMRSALRLSANIGAETMLPLLPTLESIDPTLLDPLDYSAALSAFMAAERDLPQTWRTALNKRDFPASLQPPALRNTLILQTYLLTDPQDRTPAQKKAAREILKAQNAEAMMPLLDIIENVDKSSAPNNNEPKVYENGFDSSHDKGYTMAAAQPQERLKSAVRANAIGETILLSNLVLRRASAEPFSPEALIEVTGSLETVGLYDKSLAITAQTVLAAIK